MASHVFVGILLWLISALSLLAQQRDVRISPDSPVSHQLPDSAMIQSAATIGERTLVAWGSTAFREGGRIVNELQVRILRGSILQGARMVVGGEEAVPSHFVRVLPLADRFIVLWRDVRQDAPGLYAQRFDLDGIPSGDEALVDSGRIAAQGEKTVILFGRPERGYALFWDRTDASGRGIRYRRLNQSGAFEGITTTFPAPVDFIPYNSILPGMLLARVGKDRGMIIRDDGTIGARTFSGTLFDGRYHIGADTAFAVLSDGALHLYRSLFDSLPYRNVRLPEIPDARSNSWLVSRDSAGHYAVYYSRFIAFDSFTFKLFFYRIDIGSEDSVHAFVQVDSLAIWSKVKPYEILGDTYDPHCTNARFHVFNYSYWTQDGYERYPTQWTRSYYMGTTAAGKYIAGYNVGKTPVCTVSSAPRIVRDAAKDSSRISLHFDTENVQLAAPTAYLPMNYPDIMPAIAISAGIPVVVWQTKTPDDYTLFTARSWRPWEMDFLGTVSSPAISILAPRSGVGMPKNYWYRRSSTLQSVGSTAVLSVADARADAIVLPGGTELHSWYSGYWIYAADTSGWKIVDHQARSTQEYSGLGRPFCSVGIDNNQNTIVLLTGFPTQQESNAALSFTAFDSNWKKGWSMECGPALTRLPRYFLPVAEKECSIIGDDTGFRLKDGIATEQFQFPPRNRSEYFYSLPGGGFLRISIADSTGLRLDIERYSFSGNILVRRSLHYPASDAGLVVAQREADHMLAVVRGSDSGIWATLFDGNTLDLLLGDTLVSAAPSRALHPDARFRGDSLIVVWEDYRNGSPDIYGTVWPAPRALTGEIVPPAPVSDPDIPNIALKQGIVIRNMVPVPAGEWGMVEFDLVESGDIILELFDALGRRVRGIRRGSFVPGFNRFDIDLRDIAPGVYMMVLNGPGPSYATCRIVVSR